LTQITLHTSLTLPCGIVLKNRLAKAAMTEGLGDSDGIPTQGLVRLYRGWAEGGCGLLITGNIIIEPDHLERPGNVIISGEMTPAASDAFRAWTRAGTAHDTQLWAQLSHGGRQTQKLINPRPKAPSAVKLALPGGQFGRPQAMSESDIEAVIPAFANAAHYCQTVGFTGVQIHAAHGYLLSSFLNPLANQRSDHFGGSLENRARLLLEVVKRCKAATGKGFGIGVKLNSSDFQKGGLSVADSAQVAHWLEALGVDLLEISGGNYEAPEMMGMEGIDEAAPRPEKAASTLAREAYFMSFARDLRTRTQMPVMLTGGFRTGAGMQAALNEGIDVIGLGRPLIIDLGAANTLLDGKVDVLPKWEDMLQGSPGLLSARSPIKLIRMIMGFATTYWYYAQFWRHARDGHADPSIKPLAALGEVTKVSTRLAKARGGKAIEAVEVNGQP
jgi:2,4-dienoyl-CoA reductase-like NADH-dependent reductase (Old Yellow Enzyme family)